jgi:hypothetical protein
MPLIWLDGNPSVIPHRRRVTVKELREHLVIPPEVTLYEIRTPQPARALDPASRVKLTLAHNYRFTIDPSKPDTLTGSGIQKQ